MLLLAFATSALDTYTSRAPVLPVDAADDDDDDVVADVLSVCPCACAGGRQAAVAIVSPSPADRAAVEGRRQSSIMWTPKAMEAYSFVGGAKTCSRHLV